VKSLLFVATLIAILIGLSLPTSVGRKPQAKSQIELVELDGR